MRPELEKRLAALHLVVEAGVADDIAKHVRSELTAPSGELERLRKIASICWHEMNHGFDLPSEVWEAVESYYKSKGKNFGQCHESCDCLSALDGGDGKG